MFDLFRSRAKAVRYLLGAILLVVAASMVITLIPGFVGASYSSDSNVVAEIGGEALTLRDVQSNIQQALRSNRFPRQMAGAYIPMIVNQMIADRAVAYQAAKLGFQVTDADVARAVQSMLPQLFQDGKYVGDDVYAQYLSQMNLSIPEFESNVRKQMLLLKLMNMALEGEVVPEAAIEEEFRKGNEKIKVDYISFGVADFRDQVKPTPEEIRAYYEQNKPVFRIPEKRDAKILIVEQEEIGRTITIPEEELRRAYQSQPDRFRLPERVKVRHILLKTTGKSTEEAAKAKTRAEDLLKQIRSGADFAKLAKENSEDTGSAVEGGDLDWIARGQTVENFEKTAFTLKPGEISDVISTEYGHHIIQVMEKEPARMQPFEEVKGALADERKRQMIYERMQELADQARAELVRDPAQADALGRKLGLTVYNVSKAGPGDPIPEVAASAEMQGAIRSLAKAGVTDVYQLGEDRLALAVVTEFYPEREAELSEVEDQVRNRLIDQKANDLVQQKRARLEQLMKSAGGDLGKLAREMGLTVKTSEEFTRSGNVPGLGAAAYLQEAFDKPVGALIGPINAMAQTVVCKVVEKIPADMTKLASERENLLTRLQQERAQERKELFEDGILTGLINDGEVKIYEPVIQRLISLYTTEG